MDCVECSAHLQNLLTVLYSHEGLKDEVKQPQSPG